MLAWFKRVIAPTPTVSQATVQRSIGILTEDIPRYPPFMKGLPVVGPEKLVQTQQELLSQIGNSVLVNKSLFEKHYMGALARFAAYAHLLPASQSHHHRGAGGLLRHSMEVALWALQAGDKMLLNLGKTPAQRRELEPRWQLAAFLCGLCHDAGKPATDLVVSSHDRTKVWKPITENLWDWANKNGVDAYFLDWRSGRSRQHIALSNLIADRIITTDTLSWIEEGGTELIVWLMEALNGNPGATNPLYDLVLKADQASVERDLKSMGVAMAGYDLGVPVERHLADIMRRLIKEGVWQINEPGARVWNIGGNIYLVWPTAGDEIARQVKDDGVPGLPRTADGILDMLVERQLAFVNEQSETGGRCWKIAPAVLAAKIPDIALSVIRLRDDALISSSPIPMVEGRVFGEDAPAQHAESQAVAGDSQAPSTPPVGASEPPPSGAVLTAPATFAPPVSAPVQTTPANTSATTAPPRPNREHTSPPVSPEPEPEQYEGATHKGRRQKGAESAEKAPPAARSMPIGAGAAPANGQHQAPAKKARRTEAPTLVFDGAVGEALKAIADDLKSGDKQWDVDVRVDGDERVLLSWPGAFSGYGLTAKTILEELSAKDWLWADPLMPLRKVQEVEIDGQPVKVIKLELEPSDALLYAAGYGNGKNGKKPGGKKAVESPPAAPVASPPSTDNAGAAPEVAPMPVEPPPSPPAPAREAATPDAPQERGEQGKAQQKNRSAPVLKPQEPNVSTRPAVAANATPASKPKQTESAPQPSAGGDQKAVVNVADVLKALAGLGEDAERAGWRSVFLQEARAAMKKAGLQVERSQLHDLSKRHSDKLSMAKGMLQYRQP